MNCKNEARGLGGDALALDRAFQAFANPSADIQTVASALWIEFHRSQSRDLAVGLEKQLDLV